MKFIPWPEHDSGVFHGVVENSYLACSPDIMPVNFFSVPYSGNCSKGRRFRRLRVYRRK
jgi:hypothetical protein